jgi:predicted metal-binding membrane protein
VAGVLNARGQRLGLALRWRPEWPVATVVAAAWIALLAGLGMHRSHLGMHHGPLGPVAGLPGWSLMVVAMMVPVTLPAVRYVGLNSMRSRRRRAMALYTVTYVGVWVLFGITALGFEHVVRAHLGVSHPLLLAVMLAVAGAWQLTRAKRRALFACGRTVALPPLGRRADAACMRYAVLQGWRCVKSCWAIMLVMVVVGHSSLVLMVALTALVVAEELTVSGRRLTRPAAGALGLAAVAIALGL